MSIEEIVRDIVITTEDTYDTYITYTENRSKEVIGRINDKLNQPFNVQMKLYIEPTILVDGELFTTNNENELMIAFNQNDLIE